MTARKPDNKGPRLKRDQFESRGIRYRLIEQDADVCDDLAEQFKLPGGGPNGEDITDMEPFQEALAVRSLVEPKVTLRQLKGYPNALKRTLMSRAYVLSYRIEDVKDIPIEDDDDWDADDTPGEATGD